MCAESKNRSLLFIKDIPDLRDVGFNRDGGHNIKSSYFCMEFGERKDETERDYTVGLLLCPSNIDSSR